MFLCIWFNRNHLLISKPTSVLNQLNIKIFRHSIRVGCVNKIFTVLPSGLFVLLHSLKLPRRLGPVYILSTQLKK